MRSGQTDASRIRPGHYLLKHEPLQPVLCAVALDDVAHAKDLFADPHAGRTYRLAGSAVEAMVHVLGHRLGEIQCALVDRPHQLDAATRTLNLDRIRRISGAHREAKSALYTGEQVVVLGCVAAAELGQPFIDRRGGNPVGCHPEII